MAPHRDDKSGFTLAELLLALVILGVIATFTIPKVLQTQQDRKNASRAKEAIAALSEAYQIERLQTSSKLIPMTDVTQNLNFIKKDTASPNGLDGTPDCPGCDDCNASFTCYFLASGAVLILDMNYVFDFDNPSDNSQVFIDPDGKKTGNPDSLGVLCNSTGRCRTRGDNGGGPDPSWWMGWN